MAAQEMATARMYDAKVIYLVVKNGMLSTIRMHQERNHPGRKMATDLFNPDFVTYAASFGVPSERADATDALEHARAAQD